MFDLKGFLMETIFLNIPYSLFFGLLALVLFGFKDRISKKNLIYFTLLLTFVDSGINALIPKYQAQPLVYLIFAAVFFRLLFKINIVTSLAISALTLIIEFIQVPFFLICLKVIGSDVSGLENSFKLKLSLIYLLYIIFSMVLTIVYKKNLKLIDFNKHNLLAKINKSSHHEFSDTLKVIVVAITPILILLSVNFSLSVYQESNHIPADPSLYALINSIGLIISTILMIFLVTKIVKLRQYKLEWSIQQNHINNINDLLKSLRAQKHGFINHMNVIFGLLTLNQYKDAKEYLENIQNAISTTANVVGINNPTLNALINAKVQVAENKNIKLDVKIDDNLSKMNFKAFELSEAITNIIDNAFEATSVLSEEKRFVSIRIFSDNKFYIFDVTNTGKKIPEDVLSRIFDEGFTTKSREKDDHGFGLYISKRIIEDYQGRIEVESKEDKTSFKIYLPKVMQNEVKVS